MNDLRYGVRMLLKSPGFTAVVVLSLALGIGANISIFSFVNAFLLRPLHVKDPDRLVAIYTGDSDRLYGGTSYLNFVDYRQQNDVFSDLIAFWRMTPVNLSANGRSERVWGSIVSGNYFSMLGIKAALGRTFLPEEDRAPGAHPVAVIGYGLCQRHFDSDPSLTGKTLRLNGHSFTVVGVAPKSFKGTTIGLSPDIWVPLMTEQIHRTLSLPRMGAMLTGMFGC